MSEFCSLCQVAEAGPYCLEHGLVHQPFSIGGRYDVQELIGATAEPFVFGAHDRTTQRSVVVKVLRLQATEARQRFLREAAALGKIDHEHIVAIFDSGWDDELDVAYLVMERLSGQTADAMLRRTGPLHWQQVVPLLMQICRALVAAHQRGIIDGSLTARNVFVMHSAGRQIVKLCDFGFTSANRPPQGSKPDPRKDIYGIATIAHELLTGRPPLEGSRATGSLTDDPISMNEWMPSLALPEKLDELIRTCQARNPMLRPSLAEIQATLLSIGIASGTWEAGETQVTATHVAQPDPLAVPEMIGSYRVVAELGEGGTGRVYLGQHPVIGSKVAIKVLLPEIARSAETVERFIQEARASSQIGSPHIPRFFDFGTTPAGLPYAIMEYFDGETLGDRLARVGTMSITDTAQVVTQVATALMMAHDAGLIHRDLKPDNILLVKPDNKAARSTSRQTSRRNTPTGSGPVVPGIEVKVLDFGIAKMVGTPSAHRTLTGSFLGTPFYCAPEQVFGHEVDARTDVYSLGATAFEMLTGAPPFTGLVPEILSSKATEEAPDLLNAGVPEAVAYTIRKMLAREPQHRAPSMAWVLEEVAGWEQADQPGATTPMHVKDLADQAHQESTYDRKAFARADTALPIGNGDGDGDNHRDRDRDGHREPGTASQAMHLLAAPRGRARRWTALAIAGGVLAVATVAVVMGVASSRSTTSVSSRRPPDVQAPLAGSATAQAVSPPAPLDPPPRAHDTTPSAPTAAVPVEGPVPTPAPTPTPTPTPAPTPAPPPNDDHAHKLVDEHAGSGSASPRHPRPPVKKPPVKKPAPGDPKDVLIVDPFSHGN